MAVQKQEKRKFQDSGESSSSSKRTEGTSTNYETGASSSQQHHQAVLGAGNHHHHPGIVNEDYLKLVTSYLQVFNVNHQEKNVSDYSDLCKAVCEYLDSLPTSNDAGQFVNQEEINVVINWVDNELVAAVNGPLGGLNINLEHIRRAYPEVYHIEESNLLKIKRSEIVAISKKLTRRDVSKNAHKLVVPQRFAVNKVSRLLNPGERIEDGVLEVTVYDQQLRKYNTKFMRDLKGKFFLFGRDWNKFVAANGLTENCRVQLCAFRNFITQRLCFSVTQAA